MNWKNLINTLAPTLGTALGGPLGGAATKYIADKLLDNPGATETDIADYITTASPETLARLKEIDAGFKMKMRELDLDVHKFNVEDRKSARELAKINMIPQIVLSGLFVIGYFVLLRQMMTGNVAVSPEMMPVFTIVLGVLTAGVASIMQFWFGSSSGSKEKTAKLAG